MASGSNWERDTAKFLTYWLTSQNKEYYFWRSPGSGSIGTMTGTNPDLHGDIIPLKPEAEEICNKFIFECKSGYNKASFDLHLKYNKKDFIREFWEQVCNDAEKANKYPLLLFKKKGFSVPWVGITSEVVDKLHSPLADLRSINLKWGNIDLPNVLFFGRNEFFEKITPDKIKRSL